MKTTAITIGMVCAASLCGAADATWMSNPADALWNFTSLNWGAGAAWTDGDSAVFGASETKAITIEEDVAPASVSVTADGYSFDGTGVLSVNGAFTVGDGLSVTVATPVAQTSGTLAQRLDKKGTGTLTLTGGGNFGRIGVTSGPLVLDGGTYNVVYPSGAEGSNGYRTPIFMFGDTSSELKVTGGATVNVSGTTIMKGTGTLRVENGTVDASGVDMWNCAYTDVTTGKTIIGDGGTLIVNGWLNSGFSSASQTNNVTTLVTTGGVLELKAGLVGNSSSFYSCMLFDHGTLRTTANNFSSYKNKTVIKAGPGGLYLDVPQNMTSVDGFLSDGGEQDGGLHPRGAPVLYMGGSNYHRGGTWLDDVDSNMFCIRSDEALGRVPDAPTSNIFFTTSNNILLTDSTVTVHSALGFLSVAQPTPAPSTANPITFTVYFFSFGLSPPVVAYTLNEPLKIPVFGAYLSLSPERFCFAGSSSPVSSYAPLARSFLYFGDAAFPKSNFLPPETYAVTFVGSAGSRISPTSGRLSNSTLNAIAPSARLPPTLMSRFAPVLTSTANPAIS